MRVIIRGKIDDRKVWLNGRRCRRIGEGISRQVYRSGRYVVKLVEAYTGSDQNYVEWNRWHRIRHSKDKKYFAAVLHFGKTNRGLQYIVQRYVGGKPALLPAKTQSRLRKLYGICDFHSGNVNKTRAGYVIFDYGL